MSFLLKSFRTHNIPKSFFKASKYDNILLKDVPVREFPQFLKENMGNNGIYRFFRFFYGNFPSFIMFPKTKSIVSLLFFVSVPAMFNVMVRWQFNYQKYLTAFNLLVTDEQWEEFTESQKHHFKVFLCSHLIWPEAQPPHLPPPVEYVPSHWRDDPNAPISRDAPKRAAH